MVRSVDLLPTLLDMYRIKAVPFCKIMDGEVINTVDNDRIAFSETAGLSGPHPSPNKPNIHCVRTAEWKFIFNSTSKQNYISCYDCLLINLTINWQTVFLLTHTIRKLI